MRIKRSTKIAAVAAVALVIAAATPARAGSDETNDRGLLGLTLQSQECDRPIAELTLRKLAYCQELLARIREGMDHVQAEMQRVERQQAEAQRKPDNWSDPSAINLCPPPHYHMTDPNGCQPTGR